MLQAPQTLIAAPSEGSERGLRAKICVTDWNEDGTLDIVLGDFGDEFKKELGDEQGKMRDLFTAAKKKQDQLLDMQEKLTGDIKDKSMKLEKEFKNLEDVPEKFKSYIEKKSMISDILSKISYNEQLLKGKLTELMRKEQILDISKAKKFISAIEELNVELNKIQTKRKFFDAEIEKLVKLIRK